MISTDNKQTLRWMIIIPTIFFLCVIGVLVGLGGDVYVKVVTSSYKSVMKYIGWTFGPMTIFFMGVLFYCMFSKIGNVRIGGENAKRMLSPWSFFGVTVTGITGSGLLFMVQQNQFIIL